MYGGIRDGKGESLDRVDVLEVGGDPLAGLVVVLASYGVAPERWIPVFM